MFVGFSEGCMRLTRTVTVFAAHLWMVSTALAQPASSWKFDFRPSEAASGRTPVSVSTKYTDERGYGFEGSEACFFSLKMPEGNYRVTVTTGHPLLPTDTTVRAELRRLMLEAVRTEPGEFKRSEFVVNV